MAERRRRWSGRAAIGTVLLLAAVLACVRLGFWQLDRLRQRRELNERIARRQQAPPLLAVAQLRDTAISLYRRAELVGRYDDPRSIVLPGRSLNGVPGVHLLTPLLLGPEDAVLVNRGWVPSADAATIPIDSFAAGAGTGQRAAGLLLPLPESGRRAADAGPDSGFRRVWYRLHLAALQAQFPYRILPLQLQLLPSPGAAGRPKPLATPELSNGPHLSYAIQWFSFAAIGVIGWLALVRHSRRADRTGAAPRPPAAGEPEVTRRDA